MPENDANNLPSIESSTNSEQAAFKELEHQVERGNLFMHHSLGFSFSRLGEVESFLYGLIDILLAKGILSSEELSTATQTVQEELLNRGEIPGTGVILRSDEAGIEEPPLLRVDCAARMHICHAVCCKLDFPLNSLELESGKVKWDLGRPYFIRHEADGYCTHNHRELGCCNVYADRPAVCRSYSCADDKRIWKDFERMELNTSWLEEHLSKTGQDDGIGTWMHMIEDEEQS